MIDLPAVLRHVVEQGASDLHIKVGSAPRVRVNGDLRMTPFPAVGAEECEELVQVVLPPERLEEFRSTGEADFSLSVSGLGRFRCQRLPPARHPRACTAQGPAERIVGHRPRACRRSSRAWLKRTGALSW